MGAGYGAAMFNGLRGLAVSAVYDFAAGIFVAADGVLDEADGDLLRYRLRLIGQGVVAGPCEDSDERVTHRFPAYLAVRIRELVCSHKWLISLM